MPLTLHSRRQGDGAPVILLHGLFGAGGNLGALARALQDAFTVYSVDLCGHGRSPWLPEYSLDVLTAHVRRWMDEQGLERAIVVGHSLGGKVAMQLALDCPDAVSRLVVADIAPVQYDGGHDAVFAGIEAVALANCSSREAAQMVLEQHLSEEGVIQFLLSSLRRDQRGVLCWRFDAVGLRAGYAALIGPCVTEHSWPGATLFIKGELSDYLLPEHQAAITGLFPAAKLKMMRDCGHWLHVQKPTQFNGIVRRFIE